MATTPKAILDKVATIVDAYPPDDLHKRWRRLADSRDSQVEAGGYRLKFPGADRDAEFGVDAQETLSAQVSAEFYRSAQTEDDASFFAELSGIANAIEAASYPSGTIAVIARSRTVSRNYSDPTWVVGAIGLQLKWEQAF